MSSNMELLFIVGAIAVAIVVVVFQQKRSFPYVKAGPLLSAAERAFYAALIRAVAPGQVVMAKVRVADIIKLKDSVSRKGQSSQWWKAFAQISQKHVDFVVLDEKTFEARLVVELDDSSHNSAKAKENDGIKNKSFAAAGLPLVRFKARKEYDVNEVAATLIAALNPPAKADAKAPAAAASPSTSHPKADSVPSAGGIQ